MVKAEDGTAALIAGLQDVIIEQLRSLAPRGEGYALLDFPDHANVGDSAIWLGELVAFQALVGSGPRFVCTKDEFDADALRRAVPNGVIFLHGGGNFGDIWPEHQAFREAVMARFHDRPIVQLPQTIHFADPAARDRAAAAIKTHGNFVLMVRDHGSYELARAHFACTVHLVPDMAFCLGRRRRAAKPVHPLLFLRRTDKESVVTLNRILPRGSVVLDWLAAEPRLKTQQKRRLLLSRPLVLLDKERRRELLFRRLAEYRMNLGLKMLSSAAFVITDRLHAHILCILLGIPHIALDNDYGKLAGFIGAWTRDCGLVEMAPSLDAAILRWSARASDGYAP